AELREECDQLKAAIVAVVKQVSENLITSLKEKETVLADLQTNYNSETSTLKDKLKVLEEDAEKASTEICSLKTAIEEKTKFADELKETYENTISQLKTENEEAIRK